jgi:tetratricopeptide (TPR) repeat protein
MDRNSADDHLDLIVLAAIKNAIRCRPIGAEEIVTFRSSQCRKAIPGEIVTVEVSKRWKYRGQSRLSGDIIATRLDVDALALKPLRLESTGDWDPDEHYWGEEDEPLEEWAKPIAAFGTRPSFEMEQVLPGWDFDDPFSDPISQSNDLRDAGDNRKALEILMNLCERDLRCLDAHAHLGNIVFEAFPEDALRHYAVGVSIGELSLGKSFNGVLEWVQIDNRPYLRCLHGYGLCLWCLRQFSRALEVFERILWLNPSDNQGVRALIADVRAKRQWDSVNDCY